MRRDGWRLAQLVLGLIVVGLAVRQVLVNWDAVRTTPFTWKVQPLLLLSSVLIVWAMYALLIATWRLLVERWAWRWRRVLYARDRRPSRSRSRVPARPRSMPRFFSSPSGHRS